MIAYDNPKNTNECRTSPNAVGQPPTATPPIMLFIKRYVTGLATRKNSSVEYNENFTFKPVDKSPIYSVIARKE